MFVYLMIHDTIYDLRTMLATIIFINKCIFFKYALQKLDY